jgi:uncharacterized protein (DUF1697 family)
MIYIALLRAINLAGRARVSMSDLRELFTTLGFGDVRTMLQSGNVVFRSAARSGAQLERRLERDAVKHLGVQTVFFVRTAAEWQDIITHNPFRAEALRDPGHLTIMCLKKAPRPKDVDRLQAAIKGREIVRAGARHIYTVYPDGIGRSRLTSAMIETMLGSSGTGRNWNTVVKLGAIAAEESGDRAICDR